MSLSDWTDWNQAAVARLKSHGIQNIDLSVTYLMLSLLQKVPIHLSVQLSPSSSLAAVLVLLYEDAGQLRVLLTTRSKLLRTHAGQTALPGGRVDDTDKDLNHTAVSFFLLLQMIGTHVWITSIEKRTRKSVFR